MTSICLKNVSEKAKKSVCCHLLPCKIDYNGPSRVSEYFTPYIRNNDSFLECSFRGRPLCGQNIPVPENYVGVVLNNNQKMNLSEDQKDLRQVGTFEEFTAWNWDLAPSSNDKLVKALEWIEVASVLHAPVSEMGDLGKCERSQVKRKLRETD